MLKANQINTRKYIARIATIALTGSAAFVAAANSIAVQVTTPSMAETVCPGDFVFSDGIGLARLLHPIMARPLRRGDIVLIKPPRRPAGENGLVVKRIVAIGPDRVRVLNGTLILNGAAMSEPYVHSRPFFEHGSWPNNLIGNGVSDVVIPTHAYFVMGDNRDQSNDSRVWGSVTVEAIVGRVLAVARTGDADGCLSSISGLGGKD